MYGFFQLLRYYVYLEIATEKEHQLTRVFCDGIINLRKQVACVKRSSVPPNVSEEAMERVRQSFVRSPRKSTRVATCELGMA
ncbi:hypothetical protein TNCV_3417811 [Trichonephila clavipes]|nr:hypothetical protein TNCV_3417811 [Trichonephila clavipes]